MTRSASACRAVRSLGAVLVALALVPGIASAATAIVDDTGTLPYQSTINSRWKQVSGGSRQVGNDIEGSATVTIHLNLAPWLNKNARVYMALPQQSIGVVNVEWATQGRLLPGRLQSGDRTLVYAGVVKSPILEDTIAVKVVTDGRKMTFAHRLEFHFEIDTD